MAGRVGDEDRMIGRRAIEILARRVTSFPQQRLIVATAADPVPFGGLGRLGLERGDKVLDAFRIGPSGGLLQLTM